MFTEEVREEFSKHMQDAVARIDASKLPVPVTVYSSGLYSGIKLTLDVIQQYGYVLIDQQGNVINPHGSPSLSDGVLRTS